MFSLPLLTSLLTLSLSTLSTATPTPLTTREVSSPFYLQTRVLSGDPTKDSLFAVAWHSYAGGNDVALGKNSSTFPSSLAFQNGTNIQFNLGQGNEYPWGLVLSPLDGDSYWDEWNAVGISTGYGDSFGFNGSCLRGNVDDFGGWLACDWARGVPQLFSYSSYVNTTSIPSNCAVVDLVKVPA